MITRLNLLMWRIQHEYHKSAFGKWWDNLDPYLRIAQVFMWIGWSLVAFLIIRLLTQPDTLAYCGEYVQLLVQNIPAECIRYFTR